MIVTSDSGLFGPFTTVETLTDRLRCDGADLPFSVIGNWQTIDPPIPDGFFAQNYTWNGTALQLISPPANQ